MTPTQFTDVLPSLHAQLKARAFYLSRNNDEAEDLRAETLSRAWTRRRHIRYPKTWAYSDCRFTFLDKFKHAPMESLDALNQDFPMGTEPPTRVDDDILRLRQEIQKLNTPHRLSVERWLAGKPCQGTWASRLHNAKKEIQRSWNFSIMKNKGD